MVSGCLVSCPVNKLHTRACHPERSESASAVEGSRAASFCRVMCRGFLARIHHGRKDDGREIIVYPKLREMMS